MALKFFYLSKVRNIGLKLKMNGSRQLYKIIGRLQNNPAQLWFQDFFYVSQILFLTILNFTA